MYRFVTVMLFLCAFSHSLFAQFRLKPAFPNLSILQPLDLQQPDDGTNRIFVVTQKGSIYVFPNDTTVSQAKIFLNIEDKIVYGGEMGLLGMAFDPDFKNNGYFYINYTAPSQLRTVIARYTVSKTDPDKADPNSRFIILEVMQPFENHNAGQLAFGPDGYLYIGFGDGGSGGDPYNNGQNNTILLGKMLRIDVKKTQANLNYAIPPDNPYVGNSQGIREEIWATGFRNPWRYSFDPVTKWLWVGDVGQDKWEEVDVVEKGKNYGWSIMEGTHCYKPSSGCDSTGLTMPIWQYGHDAEGGISITGGYVYRGKKLPLLYGKYIYTDFGTGRIWAITYDGTKPAQNYLVYYSQKNISSLGRTLDNELYFCSFDGKIYTLDYMDNTYVPQEKPDTFGLSENFPNPFNTGTAINVSIKDKSDVLLEVYDISGKHVGTIFDGTMEPGKYKFYWDGTNLPSGVYIYQIRAGSFKDSKKMVLLK
ncbi:MAG: T9SS type A sorting domain-containing protein [Ignavibacteria bacterium]|nr:T9SS type A sorting domain-containing protein [Ignavibacteria bacterium]MCU7502536.1 T9SS type A sorting domain-containing protein [Ignavibacteria bacterium]MCU7515261.1 T9SS type A sorting domain-containing protein [Ignavibacteria bacterium]